MTPKEKAEELFNRFRQVQPSSPYTGIDDSEAIECALIAVDEIIKALLDDRIIYGCEYRYEVSEFYVYVKQEIEKL